MTSVSGVNSSKVQEGMSYQHSTHSEIITTQPSQNSDQVEPANRSVAKSARIVQAIVDDRNCLEKRQIHCCRTHFFGVGRRYNAFYIDPICYQGDLEQDYDCLLCRCSNKLGDSVTASLICPCCCPCIWINEIFNLVNCRGKSSLVGMDGFGE